MQNIKNQSLKENYSKQINNIVHNSQEFTYFHLKIIIFFMLASFFTNFQIHSSKLFYMNPVFNCEGIEGKQTEQYACQVINSCTIIYQQTVTAQLQLYCDHRRQDRILIQSSIGLGNWIGILFSAIVSDRMGRRFCFILAFVLLNISWIIQYIGITKQIIILLPISQIIIGFSNNTIYLNFLILSSRFIGKSLNQTITLGWFIAPSITQMMISIINSYYQNWKVLFYVYSIAISTLSLFSLFILYEDPVYYFDVGEYEKCKYVIEQVERENGKDLIQIEEKLYQIDQFIGFKQKGVTKRKEKGEIVSYFGILNRYSILSYVAILGIVAICMNISGVSSQYSIQGLKLSYNGNLLIMGASNVFGYLTAIFIIKIQDNRKRGFIISVFICSIAGLMFGFKFCAQNQVVQSICMSIFKISSCWISCFFVRLKVDLAPEKYQGALIGLIQFIANFGKVIGPTFVQFSTRQSLNPIFSMSFINLTLGSLPILLLSQTKINLQQNDQKAIES